VKWRKETNLVLRSCHFKFTASAHPWMLPEKPWIRLHIDHAINFLGFIWLVVTDAYTTYPCIHATQSVSGKSTIKLLQEDFAHFGFPHTVVTDCAATFKSEEFQEFCKENGIVHLTGARTILPPMAPLNVWCKLSNKRWEVGQSPKRCAARLPEKLPAHSFINRVLAKRIA